MLHGCSNLFFCCLAFSQCSRHVLWPSLGGKGFLQPFVEQLRITDCGWNVSGINTGCPGSIVRDVKYGVGQQPLFHRLAELPRRLERRNTRNVTFVVEVRRDSQHLLWCVLGIHWQVGPMQLINTDMALGNGNVGFRGYFT